MEQTLPKIFVVILNFNGAKTLNNCLASVFQSDYKNFEVIVIDNHSQDDSFEKIMPSYSKAHFIKNSENVGFAKGNNVGIRYALEKFADYVLILNNDTTINKNTLSELFLASKKNPTAGILSPRITNKHDEKTWFEGGTIDWKKMRTRHIHKNFSPNPYKTEYITGCAMFIKKDVFKKIGLFDERFFLYYEDADFSLRANKAGFNLFVIPTITIKHMEQSNANNIAKNYWLVLSGLIFFHLHASLKQKFWIIPYLALRKIKNFYILRFQQTENSKNIHKAYNDYKKFLRQQ